MRLAPRRQRWPATAFTKDRFNICWSVALIGAGKIFIGPAAVLSENNPPQGLMNGNLAVVGDVTQIAEPVHEIIDARSRRADHLGERFLIEALDAAGGRLAVMACYLVASHLKACRLKACQLKKDARQAPFAAIGELADKALL
jgi:hypothetical protein